MNHTIAIIGSGTIGTAFAQQLRAQYPNSTIHVFSRRVPDHAIASIQYHTIDYLDEHSIAQAAATASKDGALDMVLVTTGVLHDETMMPEKALKEISAEKLLHIYTVNTVIPALIAKHFLPQMHRETRTLFAALSASVGSISQNSLGGWHAYRAAKAALNMILKNASIEIARRSKHAIIVGLHPGMVDSPLSKPFQGHLPPGKLLTADYAVEKMLGVLQGLSPEDSGKCFGYDGIEIAP